MQTELIEKLIHLPIDERVEIIERISRSVREDLRESQSRDSGADISRKIRESWSEIASAEGKTPPNVDGSSIEERLRLVKSLAGSLKMANPPMNSEDEREIIVEHLSEKHK